MKRKRFSRKDLLVFKKILLKRRAQLTGTFKHFENDALNGVRARDGDLCTLPSEGAEIGTQIFDQSLALALLQNEAETIQKIDEAIERIEAGTFGICEACERPIPKARLKALPFAKLCVKCMEKEERLQNRR